MSFIIEILTVGGIKTIQKLQNELKAIFTLTYPTLVLVAVGTMKVVFINENV